MRQTTALWQTAVSYQLIHAVALLALAGWRREGPAGRRRQTAGMCWIVGVLLFSGSLYGLALGGPRALGPVTPLGGLALLAGWALVIAAAWNRPGEERVKSEDAKAETRP